MDKEGQLKLLEETKDFYTADVSRRAVSSFGGCYYCTVDGRMCAIGRIAAVNSGILQCWINVVNDHKRADLKSPYNTFDVSFLRGLQNFHDTVAFWDRNGLTEEGLKYYARVKKEFCT